MSAYDEPESDFARRCREEREEESRAHKRPPPRDEWGWSGTGGAWSGWYDADWFHAKAQARAAVATWRTTLGFAEGSRPTLAEAKASYRVLIRAAHPDRGGTTEQAVALNLAWEKAQRELSPF